MIGIVILIAVLLGTGLLYASSTGMIDIPFLSLGGSQTTNPIPISEEDVDNIVTQGKDALKSGVDQVVSGTDIESIDNPLGTTNEELGNVKNAGFDTLDKATDLAFSLHGLSIALVSALDPTNMPTWQIGLLAGLLTVILVGSIVKKLGKHIIILIGISLMIIVGLMLFQMNY